MVSSKKGRGILATSINQLLSPLAMGYGIAKKIAKTTKKNVPFVYDEIESLIKSQLVTLEKDKKLLHSPDIEGFSSVIASNLINKLPNLNEEQLKDIIKEQSSSSFLDMITRGLGNSNVTQKDYTTLNETRLFRKVLVANRGEIALRIIRACRELGVKAVVIYSQPDKDSLAVKFADEAYCVGPAESSKSYLDTNKIIAIAKKANVDAIHPGYGFLSENAAFAKSCEQHGIKFIGPSSQAMEIMGDKVSARNTLRSTTVPVVPGTKKVLKDEHIAMDIAEKIGYPVIIKASLGGGGRGMRIVRNKKEMARLFHSASAEAHASFGNGALYMEKFIEDPKHIEFQILADKYGNVIHLGERDCSIQRRHQKLIEEAPSPALNDSLRASIGEAAIEVARSCHYEGAGTVEFLLAKNGQFYFMEMNTRIQVEHGITEMITGVDLVKEQIKIAAGAQLSFKQKDIKINGWAIECRINAEDPFADFRPSVGEIRSYLPPGGPGIRVCSSCHTGHIISPYYDSMIAKLMCGGKTRSEAIHRMKRALEEFLVEGVDTTIPFHKAVLSNKHFLKGKITTSFIEDNAILQEMKGLKRKKKKGISKHEKILLVSTAVSKYLDQKHTTNISKDSQHWVLAGRQELMQQEPSQF